MCLHCDHYPIGKLVNGDFSADVQYRGLVDKDWRIPDINMMAADYGIGVVDVGTVAGSNAADYDLATMHRWRDELFNKIRAHFRRVCAHMDSEEGTGCAQCTKMHDADAKRGTGPGATDDATIAERAAPLAVAFTGKRQYQFLFPKAKSKVPTGLQPPGERPPGWPFPDSTQVWILPSSSGRAVLTTEQRVGPYRDLASAVNTVEWPRPKP